ncbi:hypothetical protein ACRCJN_08210, partial [Aerococcus urinaeequi]
IKFLFYLAVFSWLSSLFMDYRSEGVEIAGKKSNSARMMKLLASFSVIVLIIAIAASFIMPESLNGQTIALIIISIVMMIYSLFLKKKA